MQRHKIKKIIKENILSIGFFGVMLLFVIGSYYALGGQQGITTIHSICQPGVSADHYPGGNCIPQEYPHDCFLGLLTCYKPYK